MVRNSKLMEWNAKSLRDVGQDIETGVPHLRENMNASDFEVVSEKVYRRKKDSESDSSSTVIF